MSETRDGQRYYDTGDTNIERDEHSDCERQLNEAEDKIIKLQSENARLKALLENSKTQLEYAELQAENDKLKRIQKEDAETNIIHRCND